MLNQICSNKYSKTILQLRWTTHNLKCDLDCSMHEAWIMYMTSHYLLPFNISAKIFWKCFSFLIANSCFNQRKWVANGPEMQGCSRGSLQRRGCNSCNASSKWFAQSQGDSWTQILLLYLDEKEQFVNMLKSRSENPTRQYSKRWSSLEEQRILRDWL